MLGRQGSRDGDDNITCNFCRACTSYITCISCISNQFLDVTHVTSHMSRCVTCLTMHFFSHVFENITVTASSKMFTCSLGGIKREKAMFKNMWQDCGHKFSSFECSQSDP